MGANDKNLKIQKYRKAAQDESRPAKTRLRDLKRLLEVSPSDVNIKIARSIAKSLLESPDAKVRGDAIKIFEKVLTGDFADTESNEGDVEIPEISDTVDLKKTAAQMILYRNKDVQASPVPRKHIYYEKDKPEFLAERYGDLFTQAGYSATEIPEAFFDDPFNVLPSPIGRCLNPLFVQGYFAWIEKRYGSSLPDRTSPECLMFLDDESVRRWNKLNTLFVPEEAPVGRELRRRLLAIGQLKRAELPYHWILFWAIFLRKSTTWIMAFDTPPEYATEFPGIELKTTTEVSCAA